MIEEDFEVAIKCLIIGDGAVGKSSMIQRYCKGIYTKDYKKTIGVDFLEKSMEFNGEDVRLMLWDTAGQEEFDAITKAYYRGAQACVLAFSTTDRNSFNAIEKWRSKVEAECERITMVLVQNKIDLIEHAVVSQEEAESLAKTMKLRFYRTSVKENLNIDKVFEYLVERYIERAASPCVFEDVSHTPRIIPSVFTTHTLPVTNGSTEQRKDNNPTIVLTAKKKKKRSASKLYKNCNVL